MVRFLRLIRSFDKFGEAPKLRYKGEEQYKTKFGGVISLMINVFVLVFAVIKIKQVVDKSDNSVANFESFTEILRDPTSYNFQENQYSFFIIAFNK